MKLLKQRNAAIIITICAAVLATLFGVHKSLTRLSHDAEQTFYRGVYLEKEGYTQPSIDSQLRKMVDSSLGVATIVKNYPELKDAAETLSLARESLLNAESIFEKYDPYIKMQQAFQDIYNLAHGSGKLSERDETALNQYWSTFTGAASLISNSAYNEEVARVSRGGGVSALANILRPLAFVKNPQSFS